MHFTLLTLFPEMFPGPLGHSIAGKALKEGLWSFEAIQIRDFARDKHQKVDDVPYGGGAGMVMKPEVIDGAIRGARGKGQGARLIYFTPRGEPLTQKLIRELSTPSPWRGEGRGEGELHEATPHPTLSPKGRGFILLCGRYEGVDERVIEAHKPLEISVGDYVLSGGEMAAQIFMDALIRLIPGVMGDAHSGVEESFQTTQNGACLLEYPQYTRPPIWDGRPVPETLLSGNHAAIAAWRKAEAEKVTKKRRPDLKERYTRKT